MPLTTVDNSAFDTALGAVAAGYDGPWTRTGTLTDLDSTPMVSPNSNVRYHVKTTNLGRDVYISYDELIDAVKLKDFAKEALGERWLMTQLQVFIAAVDDIINGSNFDPLDTDYIDGYWQIVLKMFSGLPMLGIQFPFEAYREVANSDFKNAGLTANIASSVAGDPVAVITNTTVGQYHKALLDWGDGHIENIDSVEVQPTISHTYTANATYTIRVLVLGPEGISVDTASAIIAGA